MSSAQHLREFIRQRLTAAAEEIFSEVEKTIVCYEEELDVQRRMMGVSWKQHRKFNRIGLDLHRQSSDLQKPHDSLEEETSAFQQHYNQGRRSSHDQEEAEPQRSEEEHSLTDEGAEPGPSWIKEEEEEPELLVIEEWEDPESPCIKEEEEEEEVPESPLMDGPDPLVLQCEQHKPVLLLTRQVQKDLHSTREGTQLVQKQPIDFLQEGDLSEGEQRTSFHVSPVVEGKDQGGSGSTVSETQSQSDIKKRSFICDFCGRSCKNRYKLELHYRTHTGERPYTCEICGKSFTQIGDLNRHKKSHTDERPHSCEICGKSFSLVYNLNLHLRTHTGEKPFSCDICGKSFSQVGNLNLHKKIHTDERPYSCVTCGKSFTQSVTLNVHMRTHTGEKPFSCDICGKSFRNSSNLKAHKRIHTGERPFSCKICGKSFTCAGQLNFHMKQKHTSE